MPAGGGRVLSVPLIVTKVPVVKAFLIALANFVALSKIKRPKDNPSGESSEKISAKSL
jgi:hypothetical protein